MEVEPWEALDLDDSDLPSLLRPCKRRQPTSSPAASVAAVKPLSQPENHPEQEQPPPSAACRSRTIPGPAGAVQAAMLRKNIDRQNQNFTDNQDDNCEGFNGKIHNNGVLSTQEYVRRAIEDTAEFDEDFTRHPWLSALQFVGAENGLIPSTPISSIKNCGNSDKVNQVVAVIKSCTPNGFGGLMVLLKDPTGTVGASVHHEVLSQSEFGKNLTIGTVLILKEVAIFSPLRSTHYLNITQRNLVKVFCLNSDSTSTLCNSADPVQYADPVYCGKEKTAGMASTTQSLRREDTEISQCSRSENSPKRGTIQGQNLFTQSNNRGSTNNVRSPQREHISLSQHTVNDIAGDEEETGKGDAQKRSANIDNSFSVEDIQGSCEVVEMHKKASSVPQWTDEQLDQLFAGDEEDYASLFS
ncbi:hypothetical protein ACS0TY_030490 [Phlomoides rotata]